VIEKIERAVLEGGLFAVAMPRGNGKTSLCEVACLWALLIGKKDFVVLIGSDLTHARTMLDSIKTELETNELLLADYPEVCYPIHRLERIYQRASGQLYKGDSTLIHWTADEIVLPTIPRSKSSAGIIRVAGIESGIRGMKYKRADGDAARPDLVLLDDPQTDESAKSVPQVRNRLGILNGAILNLAGPGKKISGLMPCTVIYPNDMADQILDQEKHPIWKGERMKMVYRFPDAQKLWDQYGELRENSLRADGDGSVATAFYRENRKAMDAGAVVAWEQRHDPDELSAIQHAMNLRLRDEVSFFSEYQNEPLPIDAYLSTGQLNAEQIKNKLSGLDRGRIPEQVQFLTMFVDVQSKILFYTVAAWESDYTGYIIDYGTFPQQNIPYFSLHRVQVPLSQIFRTEGLEGSIYAGLKALVEEKMAKEWVRDDGTVMNIDRCVIDANWGQTTDVVYKFCRQSVYSAALLPSHGKYFGASSVPMGDYKRKPGDRIGLNWRIPARSGAKRLVRYVVYDTNFWKSFMHSRLCVSMGDKGCLSLFGNTPAAHEMLADHMTSEYFIRTEGRGRAVEEWKLRAENAENHYFDCVVGATMAASLLGVALPVLGGGDKDQFHKKRLKLSELRPKRR
jgi:hypothetical protein